MGLVSAAACSGQKTGWPSTAAAADIPLAKALAMTCATVPYWDKHFPVGQERCASCRWTSPSLPRPNRLGR